MTEKHFLNNWTLRLFNNNGAKTPLSKDWSIKTRLPSTVHSALLKAKIIDEPFFDDNELKLKWIDKCDWLYETKFKLPKKLNNAKRMAIVFENVDTVADVELNGQKIVRLNNAFLKKEIEITGLLKRENKLKIKIFSALNEAERLEKKFVKLPGGTENTSRVYLRKPQYSFGWDWGPAFPTAGIKNVYLKTLDVPKIKDLNFVTEELKKDFAKIRVSFNVQDSVNEELKAVIKLQRGNRNILKEFKFGSKSFSRILNVPNPALWFPNGEGKQNLYLLEIQLQDEAGNVLDIEKRKVGIRTIELRLKEEGKNTFKFVVNGKEIFVKGVNWIPADSFPDRVGKAKYNSLLEYAQSLNANMIRVWGGGYYEDDYFYEMCDKLGLMVWQDFMFACSSYPETKDFIKNIKEEISYNVKRLRIHPSLAIWCGNNENEWIWSFQQSASIEEMPGYKIFNELIPRLLKKTDNSRPYWQSSPFGFDNDPNSQNSGNRHQWYIWSGWQDYETVAEDNSLFVTEFGFQGPANYDTFKKYLSPQNLKIQNEIFEFHNKQIEGPERLLRFLAGHLPLPAEFEDYIYLGQLNQSFALKTCLEHWRLNTPRTNGAIIWQINDVWPVTSWSLIDSELKPKMAFHFVKNSFSSTIAVFKKESTELNLFVINEKEHFEGSLSVKAFETSTGKLFLDEKEDITFTARGKKQVRSFKPNFLKNSTDTVLIVTLLNKKGEIVHRNFFAEKKWKYLTLAKANIGIEKKGDTLIITTDKPAYFVDFYSPGIKFSDRGFIVLPDEKIELSTNGKSLTEKDVRKIKIFSLNDYLLDN